MVGTFFSTAMKLKRWKAVQFIPLRSFPVFTAWFVCVLISNVPNFVCCLQLIPFLPSVPPPDTNNQLKYANFYYQTEHVEILLQQGFSLGLARALAENTDSFDSRIWVVDNSGSMQIGDGHRVSETDGKITLQPVTRWEEIQDTVIYHSQMAAVLNSYTRFRLLNDPGPAVGRQEFSVAESGRDVENDIRQARLVMTRTKPDGVTPLTEHIWEMQAEVRQMLPQLQRTGRRVSMNCLYIPLLVQFNLDVLNT